MFNYYPVKIGFISCTIRVGCFIFFCFLLQILSYSQNENLSTNSLGYGKSCEEARKDALRNALNKVAGSQIFSKTEVVNDEIVTDEINMLTSGNIMKYEEIVKCIFESGVWKTELNVEISKLELKKFIDGRGKAVSISGEYLKQKIEQELESEKTELKVVKQIILQFDLNKMDPFDFDISIGQVSIQDGNVCTLPAEITVKTNLNFVNAYLKLIKELETISLTTNDQLFRESTLKHKNFKLKMNDYEFNLRNSASLLEIVNHYNKLIKMCDKFTIVDGCLNEMFLEVSSKSSTFNDDLIFPKTGSVVKTIKGSFTKTIEEIGSLDRINIFSSNKLEAYKMNNMVSTDLVLMKYSETNPIEYQLIRQSLEDKLNKIVFDTPRGEINFSYNIKFDNGGKENSLFVFDKISDELFRYEVNNCLRNVKLKSSKLCGDYINTLDTLSYNLSWVTGKEKFSYEMNQHSEYRDFFVSNQLPLGTYQLTVKKKNLNGKDLKDVWISSYNSRGPLNAAYSMVIPGLGLRRVTYGENKGYFRFCSVVGSLTLASFFKFMSNLNYNRYLDSKVQFNNGYSRSSSYYVQGMDDFYRRANSMHRIALVVGSIGAAFYVHDIYDTFKKGRESKIKERFIEEKFSNGNVFIVLNSIK